MARRWPARAPARRTRWSDCSTSGERRNGRARTRPSGHPATDAEQEIEGSLMLAPPRQPAGPRLPFAARVWYSPVEQDLLGPVDEVAVPADELVQLFSRFRDHEKGKINNVVGGWHAPHFASPCDGRRWRHPRQRSSALPARAAHRPARMDDRDGLGRFDGQLEGSAGGRDDGHVGADSTRCCRRGSAHRLLHCRTVRTRGPERDRWSRWRSGSGSTAQASTAFAEAGSSAGRLRTCPII